MKLIFSKSKLSTLWLRSIIYLGLIILTLIIQLGFLHILSIDGFLPDLLLILIIWITIQEDRFYGIITGFLAGLLFDLFSEDILGSNALIKASAAYLAGSLGKLEIQISKTNNLRFILSILIAAILNNAIYYLIYLDIRDFSLTNYFVQNIFVSAIYTTVIALIPMFLNIRIRK